ncbi:DUF4124 domain-containing protein [Microbulbifer sp. CAU 1566]|uniref:DUF4124 domain-containing protein n=1 Tax=Microbulbifer sp. CAU 1566 TaxID=2933269 RepID=UPI0020065C23|nr:DUF4124 domain-containing protein [Microbulbifer sp. CAU 1566]MCK7598796.1 DUF4124 domain-containing protein [Microbulbifer sp. CAU 1566]
MRTFIATLTLGLGLAASVQADGIFKWVDDNGVVHFGSQPPKQEQVEVVKAPKSERFKQWQQEQDALIAQRKMATASEPVSEKTAGDSEPAPQPEQQNTQAAVSQAEKAARALRCRNAQQRLQELQSHARVREVDASGNYRVLPEQERQQRIQQARETAQTNC